MIQCARRTSSWQGAQAACKDLGIALAYAQSNTLVFTSALASVRQSGHGRSTGLTMSSGEHYRAQGMERRSSLQTRPSGLASASTSCGETIVFPAGVKPHDESHNVVKASVESQTYAELMSSMTIPRWHEGANTQNLAASYAPGQIGSRTRREHGNNDDAMRKADQ